MGDDFEPEQYKRPIFTKTDLLSKDQIETYLEDYSEVTDWSKVKNGTHIRYFANKNGKLKFRTGGYLVNKVGLPDFITLTNGTKPKAQSWTATITGGRFFRKMTINEIKDEYDAIIDELEKEKEDLEKENKKLRDLIKKNKIK